MALNFPNSPSVGDIYNDSGTGISYQWSGEFWKSYKISSDSLGGNLATSLTLNSQEINGTGDVDTTGNLRVSGVATATSGFVGNLTGNVTGNSDTTTALQTARTIGGVSFDGTGNINLPGVNASGTQDTSGNAATATALATARTIGGVSFDGTSNINLPGVNASGTQDTSGNATTATTATNAQGLTGSPSVTVTNLTVNGEFVDGDGNFGTSGQVLSSDGTDTAWINAGSLTAGAASEVGVTAVSDNASHFITFVDSSSGNENIKVDTTLTYNPSTNNLSVAGDLTIGGVLTYEDVSNVDSVGLVTARTGVRVAAGGVDIAGGGLNVTGIITSSSDVSIADKIIHTGDTDTAIRFPAADTVTVETGGSEALRVDSSGRLGINNTTPGNFDPGADNLVVGSGSGDNGLTIYSGNSNLANLYFADGTSGSDVYTGGMNYDHSTNSLALFTNAGLTALRINSSQQVLIGTNVNPGYANRFLTIGATSSSDTYFEIRNSTTGTGGIVFSDGTAADNSSYRGIIDYSHSTDTMNLYTSATTRLSLSSSGVTAAGTISDSMGPLRRLGTNSQTVAYTLVAGDAGKAVIQNTNSTAITVPNSVFTAGDMVTIINNTATNINVNQGSSLTMYNTADGSSGNRTLAQRGAATLLFTSASVAYISGSGLS